MLMPSAIHPTAWSEWYLFGRSVLEYAHDESVEYANHRSVEVQNRALLRREPARLPARKIPVSR